MESLELKWLGPPRARVDSRPVRLETRKVTALLAVLSLDRRPQSREYLAAFLWPGFGYDRSPANLRRALASLQASLGTGWLQADRDAIALGGHGQVHIDIEDVFMLVRDARAHHPRQMDRLCSSCVGKLEEAVRLHRGDFLEGFNLKNCSDFDRWQMEKREKLSQEMSWALEHLAEENRAAGSWEIAIEMARHWLALDELHEPAHRALMLLYAKSGRRSAAIRQYESCVRLLCDEIGQEPDESTRVLSERIRRRNLEPARTDPPADTSTVVPSRRPQRRPTPADQFSTRLRPPPRRPTLVGRSRLAALLDEGLHRPMTLVSAPAGFGKTTLIAEWVRSCSLPVAWLSLEEADADGSHLLASIVAALRRLDPEIGVEASQMLHAIQAPPLSNVVDSLLRDLECRPAQRVLVMDDLHLIGEPEVESYFADIVKRLPEELHLYISTRVDPPLPLARMRAGGQLVELRSNDLRFLPEEAATFLRQVMRLDLPEEDIVLLEQRTEGWAAGLQMAALSLERRADPSQFIRRFGGSHRYIMDYLVGEVLTNQPAEIQEFLLCTSILNRFRAELCDEVAGRIGAQSILEALDRGNIFLVALDEERIWYRYHHLFAELLRHRLGLKRKVEEIGELHLRAGRWLEKANDIEEAMRHYLTGREFEEALRLIEEQYVAILTHGGMRMVMGWVSRIPEEVVVRDAGACVMLGSICAFDGRAGEAELRFARADSLLDAADTPGEISQARVLRGEASVMRAFLAEIAGQTTKAIELAQKADELLPTEHTMPRSFINYILSRAYRYQGDLELAETYLVQQIQFARGANNIWPLSEAIREMVWLGRLRGRLREAEKLLDEFDAEARKPGITGPTAKLIAARAELERERGNLERASRIAQDSVQAVTKLGLPASEVCFCLLTRLRVNLSLGQAAAAADDLAKIDEIVRTSQVLGNVSPLYESERVRIFLARGMVQQAIAWMNEYRYPEDGSPINREVISIAEARVLLASGRCAEARELLDRLARGAETGGRSGRLIEILVLRAAAGTGKTADTALRRAMELAEPEGYVRVFLDEGEPVIQRVRKMHDRPDYLAPCLVDYARHLISFIPR